MKNPQFYIFGVPDGFDMYNATPERESLFQLMYDSSCHEKRKMVIYRNADNSEVSYIYSRYNMQSVKGRSNSFFGMALTFSDGYYCKDISKLLTLFEKIYSALSQNVILTTQINPEAGQARYRIGRFAEATMAVIKIEEFVEDCTHGWFGDCVVKMDDTFRLDTQSVSLKHGLYLDTPSEHIIANMKTASWVYLSERENSSQPQHTPKKAQPKPQPQQIPKKSQPQAPPKTTTEIQEHKCQQKELENISGEFQALHISISNVSDIKVLLGKKNDLYNLQKKLNVLQYDIITEEWNSLAIQISADINRIDTLIEKSRQKRKRLVYISGTCLALIALLVIFQPFKPKHTDVTPIDTRNTPNDNVVVTGKSTGKDNATTETDATTAAQTETPASAQSSNPNNANNNSSSNNSNYGSKETKTEINSVKNNEKTPKDNNVVLKINGTVQSSTSCENGIYKYNYKSISDTTILQLQNGHKANWYTTGVHITMNNSTVTPVSSVRCNGFGKVTAKICNSSISLEIVITK